jgi:5-methylcytosine-specific restriction protein B
LVKDSELAIVIFVQALTDTLPDMEWFSSIVHSDIAPLLEEYWFDDPSKQQNWLDVLLGDL